MGERIVLWRDAKGAIHAQEDRCPHRGARLSQGRVREDAIVCPYHGISIDADGRIASVPALPGCPDRRPARRAHVRRARDRRCDLRLLSDAGRRSADSAGSAGRVHRSGLVAFPVRDDLEHQLPLRDRERDRSDARAVSARRFALDERRRQRRRHGDQRHRARFSRRTQTAKRRRLRLDGVRRNRRVSGCGSIFRIR